ncbi:MAG: hypothetical protein E7490_01530 [Ruminococcaceae bacterium]|nr:hypothetical protein [Oscillospiraceae bacterium]
MSASEKATIICSKCSAETDFIAWKSITTDTDPIFKEKVRNGELYQCICPKCGNVTIIEYDTLYNEVDKDLTIYFVTSDESYEKAMDLLKNDEIEDEEEQSGVFRVVRTRSAFREKLLIYDAGYDDRTIEILKFITATHLKEIQGVKFDMALFDKQKDGYGFTFFENGKTVGFIPMNEAMYKQVEKDFSPKYPADEKDNLEVGLDWVIKIVKE